MRSGAAQALGPCRILVPIGLMTCAISCAPQLTESLLPPTSTGRVEAALRIPPAGMLELRVALQPEDAPTEAPPTTSELSHPASTPPRLEILVHVQDGPLRRLASFELMKGQTVEEEVPLSDLAGRRVLLEALPVGLGEHRLRWLRARVRGRSRSPLRIDANPKAPNLVVYLVDTLRADALGCYGSPHPTPTLDRLARLGVRFTEAWSPSAWTRPSTASLFTGLMPSSHRARDRPDALPEAVFTLAERLQLAGYATAGIVANANVDAVWGFDQGFQSYLRPEVPDRDPEGRPRRHLVAPEVHVRAEARWWRHQATEAGRPLFLYLHVVDPHGPYLAPEWLLPDPRPPLDGAATNALQVAVNTGQRSPDAVLLGDLRLLYDAEVAYTDRELGHLLETIVPSRETVMVVTADHGEAFGEHGFLSHGLSLYGEEIHIPLIIAASGPVPGGVIVETPVSLVDLTVTLLHLAGADDPGLPGVDLLANLGQGVDGRPRPVTAELDYDGRRWRALRIGRLKLLVDALAGREQLFDVVADPAERHDLTVDRPHELAALRRVLAAEEARAEQLRPDAPLPTRQVAVPKEVADALRALGYWQ